MLAKHKYKNYLQLSKDKGGSKRKIELLSDVLSGNTFVPKTVGLQDIDESFKEWVDSLTIISDDGKEFPTMVLFSNQRFSEYSQTWNNVDENNNLLLEFKAISRENNPQHGTINASMWNIPGEHFFLIKKQKVLDDNGTESFLNLSMKQPTAIDINYKLSIFTSKYQKINEFNTLLNKKFNASQCYISPNGHYMPMGLDSISDESQYNIDDRQFYSQTFTIKIKAYILTEEDFKVEEFPLKFGMNINLLHNMKADVEIEELDFEPDNIYLPLSLKISFIPGLDNIKTTFTIDTDFVVTDIKTTNIRRIKNIKVNNEEIVLEKGTEFRENDKIEIKVRKLYSDRETQIILNGYDKNTIKK